MCSAPQVSHVKNDLSTILHANQLLMEQLFQLQAAHGLPQQLPDVPRSSAAALGQAQKDAHAERLRLHIRPMSGSGGILATSDSTTGALTSGSGGGVADAEKSFLGRRASRKGLASAPAMDVDSKPAPPTLQVPVFRTASLPAGTSPLFYSPSSAGYAHSPVAQGGFAFGAAQTAAALGGANYAGAHVPGSFSGPPQYASPTTPHHAATQYFGGNQVMQEEAKLDPRTLAMHHQMQEEAKLDPRTMAMHHRSNSCPVNFPVDMGPWSPQSGSPAALASKQHFQPAAQQQQGHQVSRFAPAGSQAAQRPFAPAPAPYHDPHASAPLNSFTSNAMTSSGGAATISSHAITLHSSEGASLSAPMFAISPHRLPPLAEVKDEPPLLTLEPPVSPGRDFHFKDDAFSLPWAPEMCDDAMLRMGSDDLLRGLAMETTPHPM